MSNILSACDVETYLAPLLGRQLQKRMLAACLKTDRPQPLLLIGDEGLGKRFVADHVAAAFLSVGAQSLFAGMGGPTLEEVRMKQHPDLHVVEALDGKKQIAMADLRDELNRSFLLHPQYSAHSVWIIYISQLSEQGQNLLLKSIEEPPAFTRFILISERLETVLPTIQSRVRKIQLPRFSGEQLRELLELKGLQEHRYALPALAFAEGNPGKLLKLLEEDQFWDERREVAQALWQFVRQAKGLAVARMYQLVSKGYKEAWPRFYLILSTLLHDLALLQAHKDLPANYLMNRDLRAPMLQLVSQLRPDASFQKAYMFLQKTEQNFARYVNFEIAISALLVEIHEVLA